jgi:ornithine cyclodeaminase
MKSIDEASTSDALPFVRLVACLETMFRQGCEVPTRHVHQVDAGGAQGTVLIMPAWNDQYLGIKTVNVYPGNGRLGLPGLFAAYSLFNSKTGELLAQMDGNVITARRTAAASALAASRLAKKGASRLLVLGAGRVASLLPLAYGAVMPLESVSIWSRNESSAQRLATSLVNQGITAKAVTDLPSALAQVDMVSSATLATEPILRGEWLRDGMHVDLIGGFTPQMREADDAVFAGASIFVDTHEALQKSGDLLGPLSRGVITPSHVRANLADLCAGRHPGRRHTDERTVFKSVGTALEDLAAAIAVFEHHNAICVK